MVDRKLSDAEVAGLGLAGPPEVAAGTTIPAHLQPPAAPAMTAPTPTAAGQVSDALAAFGTGAASAAALGYDDEVAGLMGKLLGGDYAAARDKYRAGRAAVQERAPTAATIGKITGAVGTALLPAGAALRAGVAARTTIQGGLSALGASNADLTQGQYAEAARDTAVGAATGLAAGKVAQGVAQTAAAPSALAAPAIGAAVKGAGKLGGAAGVGLQLAGVGGQEAALAGGSLAALKAAGAVGQAALAKIMQSAATGSVTGPMVQEALAAGVPERIVRGVIAYYGSGGAASAPAEAAP